MRPLTLLALSLALTSAHAQSSNHAKILDIQTFARAGSPTVVSAGDIPVVIPSSSNGFTITLQIADIVYSGEFRDSRKLHSSDFIVGDSINVAIEKNKMVVTAPSGKEIKGRLIRRERHSGTAAS